MMDIEVRDWAIEKTYNLIQAPHCHADLQGKAKAWLDAIGKENEAEELKNYIAELEADVMDLDHVLELLEQEKVRKYFGEQYAMAAWGNAKRRKAAGEKWCACPACEAALLVLSRKEEMLK